MTYRTPYLYYEPSSKNTGTKQRNSLRRTMNRNFWSVTTTVEMNIRDSGGIHSFA